MLGELKRKNIMVKWNDFRGEKKEHETNTNVEAHKGLACGTDFERP